MKKVKVLVLTGDGINCESETAQAFELYEAKTRIIHIQDFIEEVKNNSNMLNDYHILALPGGFSFGDEIGSGQILSLKLKYSLGNAIEKFIADGKLIIGICNGFQTLVRLGYLPNPLSERTVSLTHNRQGHFINKWVDLKIPKSKCVWTQSFQNETIKLPIRHGEGNIAFKGSVEEQNKYCDQLISHEQIALYYSEDINGSFRNIAGMTDPTGRILGLMPHPEAAISAWLNPSGAKKSHDEGVGAKFFENAIQYCQKNMF